MNNGNFVIGNNGNRGNFENSSFGNPGANGHNNGQQRSSNQRGDNNNINDYFRSTNHVHDEVGGAGLGGRISSMANNRSNGNDIMMQNSNQLMQRAISHGDGRQGGAFNNDGQGVHQTPNRIHYFKFDQRTIHYYLVDLEKKSRELLNIDFNIPIRFCSIQTNDGKIFITGGAKNSSQSSNHAYELRDNVLV